MRAAAAALVLLLLARGAAAAAARPPKANGAAAGGRGDGGHTGEARQRRALRQDATQAGPGTPAIPTRFVVVSSYRSGAAWTFLGSGDRLALCKALLVEGEVFSHNRMMRELPGLSQKLDAVSSTEDKVALLEKQMFGNWSSYSGRIVETFEGLARGMNWTPKRMHFGFLINYEQLYTGVYGTSRLLEWFAKNQITVVHVVRMNQIAQFISMRDILPGESAMLRIEERLYRAEQDRQGGNGTGDPSSASGRIMQTLEEAMRPKNLDIARASDKERFAWSQIVHFERLVQASADSHKLNHVTVLYERLLDPATSAAEFARLRRAIGAPAGLGDIGICPTGEDEVGIAALPEPKSREACYDSWPCYENATSKPERLTVKLHSKPCAALTNNWAEVVQASQDPAFGISPMSVALCERDASGGAAHDGEAAAPPSMPPLHERVGYAMRSLAPPKQRRFIVISTHKSGAGWFVEHSADFASCPGVLTASDAMFYPRLLKGGHLGDIVYKSDKSVDDKKMQDRFKTFVEGSAFDPIKRRLEEVFEQLGRRQIMMLRTGLATQDNFPPAHLLEHDASDDADPVAASRRDHADPDEPELAKLTEEERAAELYAAYSPDFFADDENFTRAAHAAPSWNKNRTFHRLMMHNNPIGIRLNYQELWRPTCANKCGRDGKKCLCRPGAAAMLEWAARSHIDIVHFVRMNSFERVLALHDVTYTDAKGVEQKVPWRVASKEAGAYFASRPPPGLREKAAALNASDFARKIVSEHHKIGRMQALLEEAAAQHGLRYKTVTYEDLAGPNGGRHAEELKAFLGVHGCTAEATAHRRGQGAQLASVRMHPTFYDSAASDMPGSAEAHVARCVDRMRTSDFAEVSLILRNANVGSVAVDMCQNFVLGDPERSGDSQSEALKQRLFGEELNQTQYRSGVTLFT